MQVTVLLPALMWSNTSAAEANSTAAPLSPDATTDAELVLWTAMDWENSGLDPPDAPITGVVNSSFQSSYVCGDGICSRTEIWQDPVAGMMTSCEADCKPALGACGAAAAVHGLPWPTQPTPVLSRRNAVYTLMPALSQPQVRNLC